MVMTEPLAVMTDVKWQRVEALTDESDAVACRFKTWLCQEVLPAVRRGGYDGGPAAQAEVAAILARVRAQR
jgi:hypothetical protein